MPGNIIPQINSELIRDRDFREIAYVFAMDVKRLFDYGTGKHHSNYEMLQVAGVIRRLFVDPQPLASKIAKRIPMKIWVIRYEPTGKPKDIRIEELAEIYQKTAPPKPDATDWAGASIDVIYTPNQYLQEASLGIVGRRKVTPKKLIHLLANKLGGVHIDRDFLHKDDENSKYITDIYEWSTAVQIVGQNVIVSLMNKLTYDLFHACSPLLRTLVVNDVVEDPFKPSEIP